MFTGLVEDVGRIERIDPIPSGKGSLPSGKGRRLRLSAQLFDEEQPLGASVAVDGVCLTVTEWTRGQVSVDVGPETIERSTLGRLSVGARVNLERPMRLGDRLGGHLVAGHVDGVGRIASVRPRGEAVDVTIAADPALLRYVVEKGSICVDGISLTVNTVNTGSFAVSLIPHTQAVTTLDKKGAGAEVNLEVDLIGKYVEKLLGAFPQKDGLAAKLKEHGFDHE
jgi:riboflavin synthase